MKKLFSFLAIASLVFAFHSCEDVPAPYVINDTETGGGGSNRPDNVILQESFSSSLGSFKNHTANGGGSWIIDFSTAKISGYDNDTKVNTAGTNYLVSSDINLSEVEEAYITYEYILMYNRNQKNQTLCITDAYNPEKPEEGWEILLGTHTPEANKDWNNFQTAEVQIPEKYIGKTVRIAFYHSCDASSSSTWEVKNLKVVKGKVESSAPGGEEEGGIKTLPYTEEFSSSFGAFKNYTTSGAGEWIIDYSTAKAAGYDNTSKVTTAGTYYLVSPEVSLANATEAHVSFEYILMYNRGDENQQFYINPAFDESKPTEGWTLVQGKFTENEKNDWNTFQKADIQIPAEYLGKNVRFAFYYNCTAENASTWEVRNFAVQAGKVGENTGGNTGGENTEDTPVEDGALIVNGDFEGWTNGKPNHWKTSSTAGNATLSQSTDAHSGKYSVKVSGNTSNNKRLAYKEITLKAGTYKMTFFVKATAENSGSVNRGYVPINEDGKVGSYSYAGYVDNILNSSWTEVNHEFTLATDQKIALVIMNQKKNPAVDILIDDFSLTTTNGGLVDDGGSTGTPDTPETPDAPALEGIFTESFASGLGAFTTDNKTMPSDLTYVWNHQSTYQCAKASAYKGSAYASESWLISPSIDLTSVSTASLSFQHAGNYMVDVENEVFVKIKAEDGEWTALTINEWFTSSSSYPFTDATIDLSAYTGKKVQIAFIYTSTASNAGTWEIKNVVIK